MKDDDFEGMDSSEIAQCFSPDLNWQCTREEIEEMLRDDESCILYDGMDSAFIGLSRGFNEPVRAVYSYERLIAAVMKDIIDSEDGDISPDASMEYDEAVEYVDFNIVGGYLGEGTPIIVYTPNF